MIHSLVFSRIDYANSLYCNLAKYRRNKLNIIIRSSVRIMNNLDIYFNTPIRKMLYNFKILDADKRSFLKSVLLVHNIIYSTHTSNISTLIKYYFRHHPLHRASQ